MSLAVARQRRSVGRVGGRAIETSFIATITASARRFPSSFPRRRAVLPSVEKQPTSRRASKLEANIRSTGDQRASSVGQETKKERERERGRKGRIINNYLELQRSEINGARGKRVHCNLSLVSIQFPPATARCPVATRPAVTAVDRAPAGCKNTERAMLICLCEETPFD